MNTYFIEVNGSRAEISEEMVIKHNLRVGDLTPFTRCKIQSNVVVETKAKTKKKVASTADIIELPENGILSAAEIIEDVEHTKSIADIIEIEDEVGSIADIIEIES